MADALTPIQLEDLEEAEYLESVTRLLDNPDFHRFITHWLVNCGDVPTAAVNVDDLPHHNWVASRAALMQQFMEGIRQANPEQGLILAEEVYVYGERRRRAVEHGHDGSDEYSG